MIGGGEEVQKGHRECQGVGRAGEGLRRRDGGVRYRVPRGDERGLFRGDRSLRRY